jgi:hypothetical protein
LPQQSPGQQFAPLWQQVAPQQEPGQHFAPGLQQSPVNASADSEDSARTKTANSLNFIELPSIGVEMSECRALKGNAGSVIAKSSRANPKACRSAKMRADTPGESRYEDRPSIGKQGY